MCPNAMNDEWRGKTIDGRYEVDAVLGEGGMGVVLRARHKFTGASVAMKVLRPQLRMNAALAARFMTEARAPGAIGHSGIVSVGDAGITADGEPYLVMELLAGETLGAMLARDVLSL